jgi:hypothetical protein
VPVHDLLEVELPTLIVDAIVFLVLLCDRYLEVAAFEVDLH